jgi:hypothetical protein
VPHPSRPRQSFLYLGSCLAMLLLAGCGKTPKDRLQGKWLGDGIENIPPSQLAKATGWVKGTAIEFSGSKVTVTIPAETPRTGTFRVAKADGDRVTLTFLREEGGKDEATFRLADERTLRWIVASGAEIILTRTQ